MKVLIIEDEPLGVERLTKHLEDINPYIEVLGATGSIKSSVQWLKSFEQPDIILMDIELSDGQSFEIFNQVEVKSTVIFTTSYDEYALQAFKVNSIDYLLKPVKKEDLQASLEKYFKLKQKFAALPVFNIDTLLLELKTQQQQSTHRSRFLVKKGQRLISVQTKEIAYFFADGRLYYFKTFGNAKYVVDYTMDELEGMLDKQDFFRANRSFIISIHSVAQIHTYFNGKLKLELAPDPEREVIISRDKAMEFKEWMGK